MSVQSTLPITVTLDVAGDIFSSVQ